MEKDTRKRKNVLLSVNVSSKAATAHEVTLHIRQKALISFPSYSAQSSVGDKALTVFIYCFTCNIAIVDYANLASKSDGSFKSFGLCKGQGVSRCGPAVRRQAGRQKDLGSIRFRSPFVFKICGLWTMSRDFARTVNEILKWLTQLPTLMQSHSGGDSVTSRLLDIKFLTPPPPNFPVPTKRK